MGVNSIMIQLAINNEIGKADPFDQLATLAEFGFTHIHLCYMWNTDAYYEKPEIDHIRKAIAKSGMTLLDLHGSHGFLKCWYSEEEFRRQAGASTSFMNASIVLFTEVFLASSISFFVSARI